MKIVRVPGDKISNYLLSNFKWMRDTSDMYQQSWSFGDSFKVDSENQKDPGDIHGVEIRQI